MNIWIRSQNDSFPVEIKYQQDYITSSKITEIIASPELKQMKENLGVEIELKLGFCLEKDCIERKTIILNLEE